MATRTHPAPDATMLPALQDALRGTPPPGGCVRSLYPDTVRDDSRPACVLGYRDYCKALRASLPPAEHEPFEAAVCTVEFVAGEAADLLAVHGGIGAWARH